MADRPLVLLTNDDGYRAPGLTAMADALERWAQVVVIAPQDEQSACSHKFTLSRALRLRRRGPERFSLDGTPADCVYVGLFGGTRVMPRRPDLVVSGLNAGPNLGLDTYYSGTVAGAREAAMRGVPGLAVSVDLRTDLARAADLCSRIAEALVDGREPGAEPFVLNVNVPSGGGWALRRTSLGRRTYGDGVEFRKDPRGRDYLWLGGPGSTQDDLTPGTDTHAMHVGDVGITPLPLVACDGAADAIADDVIRVLQSKENGGNAR